MDIRLYLLALGAFAIGAESFVVSSLLPGIAGDLSVSITQAGYLVLLYALGYAIGAPVLAALTGSSDRRNVLTAAALVFTGGAVFAAVSQGYLALLAARIVMAFAAGLYAATGQATAVSIATPENRARAVSVVVGGTTLAVALGAPLGAFVSSFAGWRGTYAVIAAMGIVAALAIRFMLPKGLRGERKTLRERFAVLGLPGVRPTLLVTLLYMTGPFAVFVYIAPLAVGTVGLVKELLPAVLLTFGIGAAIGNYLGGQVADKLGPQKTTFWVTAISVPMLLALSFIPLLPEAIRGSVFMAFLLPWGIVGWGFLPAQVSRLVSLVPTAAPLVLSLNGSALYLGSALGALVGGVTLQYGGAAELGAVGALFPLAGLGVMVWMRRRVRPVLTLAG
jgi:DHA1 family inner membrane transport protein